MHHVDKYSQNRFDQFGYMFECSFMNEEVVDLSPVAVTYMTLLNNK